MQIGNLNFNIPIFLAPMAGVTDIAYCILAREMGCSLVFSEMVSALGINFKNEHTLSMLHTEQSERPIAIQIFGSDPETIAKAAIYVEDLGVADIIDFNMGCPAPKIVKNGAGSALLLNPEKVSKILTTLKKAISLPLTVKMRIGWNESHINAVEIAKIAEYSGVDAIAVHGRTREQYYSGHSNWNIIAQVKKSVNIPVIANGDIRTCEDLQNILTTTKCDAVMIGRAAQGNPWIFRKLKEYYLHNIILPEPTILERGNFILRHLDMLLKYKGEYIGTREMRKHATWYTKGIPGGAHLREAFNRAEIKSDFINIVEKMISDYNMNNKKGEYI